MEAARSFPTSYRVARRQFLEAARDAGANLASIRNPNAGPEGEVLATDVAYLGARLAQDMLVLSSGTHGVEGFAGSGIQTRLLREGIGKRLPPGVGLLMIHAINPFGMAYLRRFTEDNIDLNRNFRDHTQPYPANPSYDALADIIAPRSLSFGSEVRSWSRLLWYRLTAGKAASQAAVSGGQYSHPGGLFYGGTVAGWSNETVRSIVRDYLSGARRVIVVDVHTGLGQSGAAEVILNVPDTSPAYQRALAIWGSELVESTVSGGSVSPHLEASLKLAIPELLPNTEVTAVSLEFGTVPPMEAFKALRAENWLYHYGGPSNPKTREIKTCLLRAFHPDDASWEEAVWHQGSDVVDGAVVALRP